MPILGRCPGVRVGGQLVAVADSRIHPLAAAAGGCGQAEVDGKD
jgi:hypothetical protein